MRPYRWHTITIPVSYPHLLPELAPRTVESLNLLRLRLEQTAPDAKIILLTSTTCLLYTSECALMIKVAESLDPELAGRVATAAPATDEDCGDCSSCE